MNRIFGTADLDATKQSAAIKLEESIEHVHGVAQHAAEKIEDVVEQVQQDGWLSSLNSWRRGIENPGTFETLTRDVAGVFVNQQLFDGAKFDFAKVLSVEPAAFNVVHSFTLGSQTLPPTYAFMSVYSDAAMFLRGSLDHDGNLQANASYQVTPQLTVKINPSVGPQIQPSAQLEAHYQAREFTSNVKLINPSVIDGTGIYVASHLHAVTSKLAVGVECAL